jgi:hypothetical protein
MPAVPGAILRATRSLTLAMTSREREGKKATPTLLSSTASRSRPLKRRDTWLRCGQEDQRRKRHIDVDTLNLLVGAVVHAADVQDRDGAPAVLKSILNRWP